MLFFSVKPGNILGPNWTSQIQSFLLQSTTSPSVSCQLVTSFRSVIDIHYKRGLFNNIWRHAKLDFCSLKPYKSFRKFVVEKSVISYFSIYAYGKAYESNKWVQSEEKWVMLKILFSNFYHRTVIRAPLLILCWSVRHVLGRLSWTWTSTTGLTTLTESLDSGLDWLGERASLSSRV